MLAMRIKYETFEDDPQILEETFEFNLSRNELTKLEIDTNTSFSKFFKNEFGIDVYESKDVEELKKLATEKIKDGEDSAIKAYEYMEKIVLAAYGVRSEDGKRFIKSKELSEEFSQTDAFSELMVQISLDPEKSEAFLRQVLPRNLNA